MKKIVCILLSLFVTASISSCVTGNDDSVVLKELEDAFKKTPRVTDLLVDGVAPSRDSLSNWVHFSVNPGDVVSITAILNTGDGASSSTYTIYRQYYGQVYAQEGPMPVEPMTEMDFEYGAGSHEFSLNYTVPTEDDDGFLFEPHNIITITFISINDKGGAGFTDLILEYEE